VPLLGPDLDVHSLALEKWLVIELGLEDGLVRRAEELVEILPELALFVFGESFVRAANGEVMGITQHVSDGEQIGLGGIDEADAVVDVVLGYPHAAEIKAQPVGADEVGDRAITPATCDLLIDLHLLSVELAQPIEQPHLVGIVADSTYHGRSFLEK
jgi:hypothetical protein